MSITVQLDSNGYTLLNGHLRYSVAQQRGVQIIPVLAITPEGQTYPGRSIRQSTGGYILVLDRDAEDTRYSAYAAQCAVLDRSYLDYAAWQRLPPAARPDATTLAP